MKRFGNLYDELISFESLLFASRKARRGKRMKEGCATFEMNLEEELWRLHDELHNGTWVPGPYREFTIYERRPRKISAAPYRDRVVHHALCSAIEPVFERCFIHDSYACRVGRGTHAALERFTYFARRSRYLLKSDIRKYFPSIDHEILKVKIRRKIKCSPTLTLIDRIIDGSNPQDEMNVHFRGDDLFTPYNRRRGIPIGNLTSQFFANVYLDGLDHFVKEVLRAPYVRYVDDFALFHDDAAVLADRHERIARYLEGRRLVLHPRKTVIVPTAEAARFLGYELFSGGRRRLPDENVDRFAGRLRALRQSYRAGRVELDEVRQRVSSWIAHAAHANTWRLRHALFRGGMFDPAMEA